MEREGLAVRNADVARLLDLEWVEPAARDEVSEQAAAAALRPRR